jgi:hypothetical protein
MLYFIFHVTQFNSFSLQLNRVHPQFISLGLNLSFLVQSFTYSQEHLLIPISGSVLVSLGKNRFVYIFLIKINPN